MKKLILIMLLITQFLMSTNQSREYKFMKDTYSHMYSHQKLIEFLGLMINDTLDTIESECSAAAPNTDCPIDQEVKVMMTKSMSEASKVFFGENDGYETGEVVTIPPKSMVFRKISDSRFQYAVSLDYSKIESDMPTTFTFSWNDVRDVSRVYYTEDKKGYNSSFTLIKKSGGNKMISNGYFDERENGGDAGVYIMETRSYDEGNNGITERMSYFDMKNNTEVLSKGKISNRGGSVFIEPFSDKTFDANGNDAMWQDPNIGSDSDNGAILKGSDKITVPRLVIVPKGQSVNKYNIVGYAFKAHDSKNDLWEWEYFGDSSLLAPKGASSDSDQLDFYALDNKNRATVKVSGPWFTKE